MAGLPPQLLQGLMGGAGAGTPQAPIGPEALLAVLASLAFGMGPQTAQAGGNATPASQQSMAALLPLLLQAVSPQATGGAGAGAAGGGGAAAARPGKAAPSSGASAQQASQQQEPVALTVLRMLGLLR